MASDTASHDQPAAQPSPTLIRVEVEDIDRLNMIARNLQGLVLILSAAAAGDPAFAAVDGILRPIDEELQKFKTRLNQAWQVATRAVDGPRTDVR